MIRAIFSVLIPAIIGFVGNSLCSLIATMHESPKVVASVSMAIGVVAMLLATISVDYGVTLRRRRQSTNWTAGTARVTQ